VREPSVPAPALAVDDADGRAPERHPDGVVLEPPPALPSATVRADARGVIALREPRGEQEVQRLVRSLVDGFEHESIEEVMRLFAADAGPIGGRFHATRDMLARDLQMRMGRVDYAQLAGLEVYRKDKIQTFEYDELGGEGEGARPAEMRPGDLLVRVPIELARLNGERFFPDVLTLLLRSGDKGVLKIAGWGEADNP
jgi:hypothetical protein